ncbi:unnamed protein product [Ilex paraguariensis]|uniref:Transcription factor Tfb2 C-terminal domain-containing protein n=1 Tax=Ilex paraguariensis TaxID=185542 RepID=A0ABC8SDC7_9AQUA
MYAYSTSKLHCEILRLFSRYATILFQICHSGKLSSIWKENISSRTSLLEQLKKKICTRLLKMASLQTRQIISFLQQNAHPRVAERVPSVPENVTDQIRLWESDLNRIEMTAAHLYDEFPSREVFEAACDFAQEYGGQLWMDSKSMRVIVKAEILTNMKEFLRRQQQ